ncbi:MAG: amidohydrolase family protein [Pigmentiphaga sp.]|uniref:amidohydrolase n=1 Tax=Pigmentiphaga sp. TaxID=1977564 RepID=UPI0029B55450|nr:amidohydrolase family protein [Pigmentiphaga sp.]MDX3908051.1 amidohydrolase family protein [Pigmentiphaga sp.]
MRADHILSGQVLTLDDAGTRAEAVAIAGGRILATGTRQAMLELRGPHTVVRDFPAATLIPGFNDAHAHMDSIGTRLLRPSLEGARSIADVLARIKALARNTRAGEWIVTMPVGGPPYYFEGHATLQEGRLPNRYELDSVAPDHPVYIPAPGGYWGQPPCHAAMNSLGLRLNGIDRDTVPSSPNIVIQKDEGGEPLGVFTELGYVHLLEPDLLPAVPRFTYVQRRDGILRAMALYHRAGITSIYEGHGCAPEVLAAYREAWEHGDLTMRTAMTLSPRWRNEQEAALAMRDWMPLLRGRGMGDAMFRVSGVFVAHGGDPCVRAIQHRELDYMGWSGYVQQVNSTEEFEALCMLAGQYDLRVHTVVSDKLAKIVPVMERVARRFPIGERRWVLEHISRSTPEDLTAIRRLGLATTLIPAQYLWKHGTPFLTIDEQAMDYLSPARQLFELGVPVAAGTDSVPYDPLFCLWSMTTRRERTTGRVMGPGGIVSNEVALRLVTRAGAWLTFEEREKGQLVPGHYADIAVLSGDPVTAQGDALRELSCLATMVGGRWVHGEA